MMHRIFFVNEKNTQTEHIICFLQTKYKTKENNAL